MAKGISPVSRTLSVLKSQGLPAAIVEKWNQYGGKFGIRQDLFGIIDILALDKSKGVVGVQVCGSDFQDHIRKFKNEKLQECKDWLETPGCTLELWGWRKVLAKKADGKRGKAKVWAPRIQLITLEFLSLDGIDEEE